MLKAIKKFALKYFSPYTTMFINDAKDEVEIHYSWTFQDAVEWTGCSLREERVVVYRYNTPIVTRLAVSEV
jgi:hypothetical protein